MNLPTAAHDHFKELRTRYLANPGNIPSENALKAWRRRTTAWTLFQHLVARSPLIQRREAWVGRHRIRYLELGALAKPPVVLVHGFGACKENWLQMALVLSRRYRLLIPDVPGFSQSDFIAGERYTLDLQAERLATWYGNLELAPAHWVGNSMGGAIAGLVAARHPDKARSLTLMNAAGVGGRNSSPFEQHLAAGRNPLIPTRLGEAVDLFRFITERRQALLTGLFSPLIGPDMVRRNLVNRHLFIEMLAPESIRTEELSAIKAPTLVLWGDCDRVLDVSCVDSFQALIPQAQSEVFAGVGHLPMLEVPVKTARALRSFWNS